MAVAHVVGARSREQGPTFQAVLCHLARWTVRQLGLETRHELESLEILAVLIDEGNAELMTVDWSYALRVRLVGAPLTLERAAMLAFVDAMTLMLTGHRGQAAAYLGRAMWLACDCPPMTARRPGASRPVRATSSRARGDRLAPRA